MMQIILKALQNSKSNYTKGGVNIFKKPDNRIIVTKDLHLLPGRMRIKIPGLKRNNLLAQHLHEHITTITGVKTVSANPHTGRALIYFDSKVVNWRSLVRNITSIYCYTTQHLPATSEIVEEQISVNNTLSEGYDQAAATVLTLPVQPNSIETKAIKTTPGNYQQNSALPWHVMSGQEALTILNSNATRGLTRQVGQKIIKQYGPNEFTTYPPPSLLSLILEPFKDFMTRLLLGAAGVSFLLGEFTDAAAIAAIVALQAVLGAIQSYKAEKSLAALKKLSVPLTCVIRDGAKTRIPTRELVPGDIILLETGDKVPADARILESVNLMVEEASLTGESIPVPKTTTPCRHIRPAAADKNNMIFMGTSVTGGRTTAVVVATGMGTEMGQIASMLQQVEAESTPLQRQLETLGKQVTTGALAVVMAIAVIGVIRGRPVLEMLRTGISLAVGAIPEGLPAVVTLALAFGVHRMVKKKAVVRKLPAVETLGCATVVCTDKTGTLTKNEMTVKEIYCDGISWEVTGEGYQPEGKIISKGGPSGSRNRESLQRLLTTGALCSNAQLLQKAPDYWTVYGDPTEGALLTAAAKAGLWWKDLQDQYCRFREIAFESERKMMTVICRDPNNKTNIYTKGAPDKVLACCSSVIKNGRVVPLDEHTRKEILAANDAMSDKALRVLALAYKPLKDGQDGTSESLEKDIIFTGLVGMMDPPRPGVKEAIKKCHQAGVKVVMITGDQQNTARAIARDLNILDNGLVLSGHKIENMSDTDLAAVAEQIQVCSGTSPAQKLRIVRALKSRGYIVAMTGDGVNDAPAVKEADIGLAMGKSGTDVTREAAGITLADDNFTTIEAAIQEGRTVGDNIRKSIRYILSGNLGEVLAIFLAAVSGLPTPLVPAQILWVNLVSEGFPAMALVADPPQESCMDRPPREPDEKLLSRNLTRQILSRGLLTGITTFGVFLTTLLLGGNLVKARTLAFANLVMSQIFNVFGSRHTTANPGTKKPVPNLYLLPAAALSTALLLVAIYLPALQTLFSTVPLSLRDWGFLALTSILLSRTDRLIKTLSSPKNTHQLSTAH